MRSIFLPLRPVRLVVCPVGQVGVGVNSMSLFLMIALGLIPWLIAVERLVRGRNRDLDRTGIARPAMSSPSTADARDNHSKLLADDTLFGAITSDTAPSVSEPPMPGATTPGTASGLRVLPDTDIVPGGTDASGDDIMAVGSATAEAPGERTWPRMSPDLAIIDSFVPGDDLLELTLDEEEVAAAERAGVALDIRVERSSTGRGSLITVAGTPLAFVRGSTQVTPRDVILRVERLAELRTN